MTVVDVSRRAVVTASLNALRHGRRLRARRGHLFRAVEGRRFDVIAANPPYVPSASAHVPTRGPGRAWAAGHDGRVVLDEICDRAAAHLAPGGELLLVHSSIIGERETLERLLSHGFATAEVIQRRTGPLGPLMVEQQRTGRVPADLDHEDVVVVSARTASA